jgi:hypothetical protein
VRNRTSHRSFGIVLALLLGLIAYRSGLQYLWGAALLALVLAFVYAKVFAPFNQLWFRFGLLLAKVISPIVLTVFYYLIFAPMAIVMKLSGHKPFRTPGWVSVDSKPPRFEKPF